jgi:hypothetical protein
MGRNRWITIGAVAAAFLLASGFIWFFFLGPAIAQARVATGYMAKTICSCLFVDGGALDQCRADALLDREPALARVGLHVDPVRKRVRASFLPFTSDVGLYEEGYGCRLK